MTTDAKPEPGGTGTPPAEGPKYVTEEQLDKTLTSRFRSVEQRVDKAIERSIETIADRIKTDLQTLLPAPPAAKPPGTKADGEPRAEESGELKKLQDQIASLTQDAQKARAERDAERAKAKDTTLRARVGELLAAAGIEGTRGRHATGLLVDVDRRVRWAKDGETLVFRKADREDVELEEGLREWLTTDEARIYLPPRGAHGSGDRPGGTSSPASGSTVTRELVSKALGRAAAGLL